MTDVTAAPIVPSQRPAPAPATALDDGRRIPGGRSDESSEIPLKFSDLIALINPLQHLPIIGPLYRKLTGDEPHPAVKAVGGLIFGGPSGLMGAVLGHVLEQTTGKSMIDIVADVFSGSASKPAMAAAAEVAIGPPRMLVPVTAAAITETASRASASLAPSPEASAPTLAAPTPAAPTPAVPPPPPTPAQTSAVWTATRQVRGHDIAWYQANAGARMPSTASTVTSSASQPTIAPRSVGPSYAPGTSAMNEAGGRKASLTSEEFMRRASILQDRYAALRQQLNRRDALVDRFE
ncbi:MAG: hypothetical protein FJX57_06815 [Alphaproteobacteria bacterium]|nr:hypothetical protein [Alphaproteobacteria bacterium]